MGVTFLYLRILPLVSPFVSEEAEAELEPLLDEQGLQADPSVPLTHAPWRAQDMAPGPSPCLAILSTA